jgi:RNA polymerase sigma-70 factor (ECF subfamily)
VDNFERLANQHKDKVYRQMVRVCGNHEDAEDVLIEALLKAYRHMEQLHNVESFRPWLAQIARRVCWQLKKREALLPLMQLSVLEEEGGQISTGEPPMESQLAVRQLKDVLQKTLHDLPESYRRVYEMRDLEDFSGEEVARKLGLSVAAVKSRLHRARAFVRQGMDRAISQSE